MDWKEEYTHASQSRDYWKGKFENMRADFEMVDDASQYWKETFEEFYNAIHRAVNLDGETYTDGEIIDLIYDKLKTYGGETDNQHEL